MLNQFETMLRGKLTLKYFEGFKLKLHDFFAYLADQVVMVFMTEHGFIAVLFSRENRGLHQPCFDQEGNRSIDGSARRRYSFSAACPNQAVYFEMTFTGDDRLHDGSALGSQTQGSVMQHLSKSIHGSIQGGADLPLMETTSHLELLFSRTSGGVNEFDFRGARPALGSERARCRCALYEQGKILRAYECSPCSTATWQAPRRASRVVTNLSVRSLNVLAKVNSLKWRGT